VATALPVCLDRSGAELDFEVLALTDDIAAEADEAVRIEDDVTIIVVDVVDTTEDADACELEMILQPASNRLG
jgi:hypothetical protein